MARDLRKQSLMLILIIFMVKIMAACTGKSKALGRLLSQVNIVECMSAWYVYGLYCFVVEWLSPG